MEEDLATEQSSHAIVPYLVFEKAQRTWFFGMGCSTRNTNQARAEPRRALLDPFQVLTRARVHANTVPNRHEQWHLYRCAGLEPGGFRPASYRVAPNARCRVDDGELHGVGQLNRNGAPFVEDDRDLHVLLQVAARIAHQIRGQRELLERLLIHQHVLVPMTIQVLHRRPIQVHLPHVIIGGEVAFEHGAGSKVAQFGTHKGLTLRPLMMMRLDDNVQLAVQLDDDARTKIVTGNHDRYSTKSTRLQGTFRLN